MAGEMTRAEFYEKYGEVRVCFSNYYKYTFTFQATLPDGKLVCVEVGGNSDEIYRFEVTPNSVDTIKGLNPYSGSVLDGGEVIESFYDY